MVHDHRRRVLASWLLARLRLKQPDLVNLIATQIRGVVIARYVVRTEPLASPSMARRRMALAPALQVLLSGTASTWKAR